MTLSRMFDYAFTVTIIGLFITLCTILLNHFGKKIRTTQNGQEKVYVEYGELKFYIDTLRSVSLFSLSLIIVPLLLIYSLVREEVGIINPAELCEEYEGKYSLANEYYFIDDLDNKGIRANAEKGHTSWEAVCNPIKDGGYQLEGRDKTIHSLEVKLKDSTKSIHVRKFESLYDSIVYINKNGKFEWRRINNSTGVIKPLLADPKDFTKNTELNNADKEYIEEQIELYFDELKKDRTELQNNRCFITSGRDRGVRVLGFTCLDRYTRMMRQEI